MTFVRNLFRDLVDKKLWPVALVLVAALVAIPVVLGGGSETASTTPPATTTGEPSAGAATAGSQAQIAVATAPQGAVNRKGDVRNPFNGPKAQTATDATADGVTTDSKATADKGTGTGGTTDTTTETPSTTPEQTVTKPKPAPDPESEPKVDEKWVAVLRFGVAGVPRTLKPVPRLAPLPSAENPVIVFLGVLDDHKTALFLVGSDADTTGDGTCKPSKDECETVRLTKDETQFFDVTKDDGSVVQYQLDLDKVRERMITKKAIAANRTRSASAAWNGNGSSTVRLLGLAVANVPGIALP